MKSEVTRSRSAMVAQLFPNGIPELWCPLLTHYRDDRGSIDIARIRAHLLHLSPVIRTFLAPGSTGDGWEMTEQQQQQLVQQLCAIASELDLWIMMGVLRTGPGEARSAIQQATAELQISAGDAVTAARALAKRRICGFTVTPPRGSSIAQDRIHTELAQVAELGYPLSIYQLPQVTENEMTPQTVADLAQRYPNFYLFKDTSGSDTVATAGLDYQNVFLVRGAEQDYAQWHHTSGGPYNGFLLSTANCFAFALADMLAAAHSGNHAAAAAISERVSRVAGRMFSAAAELPFGNPFSNANRAIDHVFAYGSRALNEPPPLTCSGNHLPIQLIELAHTELQKAQFEVSSGYLL